MAVLIRDMDLPKKCSDCALYSDDYSECLLYSYGVPDRYGLDHLEERPDWCKLEEVKE